ncbi:energy transducer TonB [Bernardetia sp. ABR2-2B]|uniref:energy transducer TonB n=1 Tax=Bernardetia sp. ABR2-2B TaxID=3127472 RepID=UPI0030D250D9
MKLIYSSFVLVILFISTGFVFSTPRIGNYNESFQIENNLILQDTSKKRHEVTLLDVPPEFKGGMSKFYEYVSDSLVYPESARKKGIEGSVSLEFIVDKKGNITNVEVVKSLNKECDEEAVRVLQQSPQWKAGYHNGRIVKVRMTLPIIFKLNPEEESGEEIIDIDY